MISIIVPVYNAERYLDRCIMSVLNQTFSDLELILVNDGSRDGSVEICNRYANQDSRILVIDKPNGGVSSARNAGILKAQGEYISFLDADDYLSPDFLSNFHSQDISVDFYSQGCVCEYPDRPAEYRIHEIDGAIGISKFMESMIKTMLISSPWGKLYRSSLIKKVRLKFDENLSYAEDRLFNVAYLNHCKSFYLSDKAGYHYTHENPAALTQRRHPSEKLLAYVIQYRPLLRQLIHKSDLSQEIIDKATFSYNYDLILSIINKFRETDTYQIKASFLNQINKELIADVKSQKGFPVLFRLIAGILTWPETVGIPAISIMIKLKEL